TRRDLSSLQRSSRTDVIDTDIDSHVSSILQLHFSFLKFPRPLRPTLFPYTTLFRSLAILATRNLTRLHCPLTALAARQCTMSFRDRKSTRLNSSHGSISYAVFCLKKKNNHIMMSSINFAIKRTCSV